MHSSIRRPMSRSHTVSPRSQPFEASESESSRNSRPNHEQFINGQPAASLNGQHPSIVSTFRSNTRNGQYEAETTPNIAYIERTSSMRTTSLRSHGATRRPEAEDRLNVGGIPGAERSTNLYLLEPADTDAACLMSSRSTQTPSPYPEQCTISEPWCTRQSFDLERLRLQSVVIQAPLVSDTFDQSDCNQEQRIAQVLATASENDFRLEAIRRQ
ncbi:hypothetical protein PMIN06_008791 [Paraphaeosphaeria minitans]